MAEHVVKIIPFDTTLGVDTRSPDLVSLFEDYRDANVDGAMLGHIRHGDDTTDAVAEHLAQYRDALGSDTDSIHYHECRHDEGIGDCAAVLEIK